ncbi:phage tail tape measure protein [Pontibacterium granulatum]|uniref:phage tail tape measure protein n=1 Tax=Pontibacterium granulatum TaxID=2036029 RepID=UPI00249C7C5D|nr:phage tail tape measure protein [Pontibacterium granulatum]MDI3326779.1 phage tail tape measure protein [Pontibacterium granulatum]
MNAKNLALNLLIKAKDLASDTLEQFQGKVKESGNQAEALDNELQQAGKSTRDFNAQLTESDKALGRFYDKQGKLREANGQFVIGAKRAKGATKDLGDELDNTRKDAGETSGQFGKLTGMLKGYIAAALAALGTGSLFGNALASSKTFEKQLDKVAAVTSATREELVLLRKSAEDAGSTTRYTSTQAAEGLEILARAGYTARESTELLPTLLSLATAEELELSDASQILSDVLSIMGKEARDGANAADTLAKGASLSATTISQLGLAISYAGSYTQDFKLDLVDLVALLDTLAKNGLRGERAGTALRSILSQLSDPASKASQELDKLGISTHNLNAMIDGLRAAGDNGKAAVLAFGVEAGPALKALLAEGSEEIQRYTQALQNAEGAAQQMAETTADNLDGSLRGLGSVWDFISRKLSDPLLRPLTNDARNLTAKLHELAPAFETFGSIAATVLIRVSGGLRLMYNLFTLAAKSIGIFTSQIAVWATDTELALAKVLNSVGLVADETVKALEIQAGGVRAVLEAMKQEAAQDIDDINHSFNQLISGQQAVIEEAVKQQQTLTAAVKDTTTAVQENSDAVNQAANNQAEAAKQQTRAWKALGLDIDKVTGSLTRQGKRAIDAFTTIAQAGTYSADQIRLAFDNALANTSTAADAKALKAVLRNLRKEGKLTARQYHNLFGTVKDRIKALEQETPNATREIKALGDVVADTSRRSRGDIDSLTASVRELQRTVQALAGDYKAAALEATNLAQQEQARSNPVRRSVSGGSFGGTEHYDLLKEGNTEAAALFRYMADAYGETLEGRVLHPKYVEEVVATELQQLKQTALQQVRERPDAPVPHPHPRRPHKTLRVEFAAPGYPSVSGDFNEGDANQLLRMLNDVGRVTG